MDMVRSSETGNENLGECLWAYIITILTFMGATPYPLLFGREVVVPCVLLLLFAMNMTIKENYEILSRRVRSAR